LGGF